MKYYFTVMMILFGMNTAHAAGDQGLYAAAPPPDAGFVRIVNASVDGTVKDISINGTAAGDLLPGSVSEYAVVTGGKTEIKSSETSLSPVIEAGEYYTVVLGGKPETVIKDKKASDPAKAIISFYNLSDKPVATLISTTHKAEIFKDIPTGSSGGREINAVTVGLSVTSAGAEAGKVDALELKRQMNSGIFLIGTSGNYRVVTKTTAPKK